MSLSLCYVEKKLEHLPFSEFYNDADLRWLFGAFVILKVAIQ